MTARNRQAYNFELVCIIATTSKKILGQSYIPKTSKEQIRAGGSLPDWVFHLVSEIFRMYHDILQTLLHQRADIWSCRGSPELKNGRIFLF